MNEDNKKFIIISTEDDLYYLIDRIEKKQSFAHSFKFEDREHFHRLLEHLNIQDEHFRKKYFHFDKIRNLHISESEFGYVWISTYGLISKDKSTDNNLVNACFNQYTTLSLLIDKAIAVASCENVYDVDGYNFGYLSTLTPALFHNILFYIEVFGKAYLALSGANVPHTHEISKVYSQVTNTMFDKKHNNSLFHALIVDEFEKIIAYVDSIPGNFKEHFVKYDDNSNDNTVIVFNLESIIGIRKTIDICNDFISSYYHDGENTLDLKYGLFDKIIGKAETKNEKNMVINQYSHFLAKARK